jgi:Fe-S cluster assembly protein SufB
MSTSTETIEQLATREYKYGFYTDVEVDTIPKGLNEDVVRMISEKKGEPEWLLEWRLKAYRLWLTMKEPTWQNVKYEPINYQDIVYYSAPKKKKALNSLDEVDPEVKRTFDKLGIPLEEQKLLSGVAVDAVFDSVSVATTFRAKLAEMGIIFCSFSEAARGPAAEPGRGGPRAPAHVRAARHPAAGAEGAGRRGRRRRLRQRVGCHHLQGEAGRAGHHLRLLLGCGP